jgi:hypothetical protein
MKPADLREFAEKLYVTAPRHEEFAKEILELLDREEDSVEAEILELLDREEDSVEAEMIEELEHQCQNADASKVKTPLQMIEYLGDRDDVLTEIEKKITDTAPILRRWGIPARAIKDVDDTVGDLLDLLDDIELALNAEGLTGNILDMLAELRERKGVAPMEYDL